MVRIFAALLLALALLAAAFGGFWFLALRYAEAALAQQLGEQLGATLSYDMPVWQPDFSQVHVTLPNVLVRIVPPGSSATLILKAHELDLMSGFFDQRQRLRVRLPKEVQMVWQETGKAGDKETFYSWVGENPNLTFMNMDSGDAVLVRIPAGRLSQDDATLLAFTDGYLGWMPGKQAGGRRLELGMKNVRGVAGAADDMVLRAEFAPAPALAEQMLRWLHTRTPESRRIVLERLVAWMRGGGHLRLEHGVLKTGSSEVAVMGHLTADSSGRPQGELTATANTGEALVDWIEKSGLLLPGDVEERYRRENVMAKLRERVPNVQVVIHQGTVIMNTQRIGPADTLADMVGKWR